MLTTFNRPSRHRYIEFKDGQFVTIHQTKESHRLGTQSDKQRFENMTISESTNGQGSDLTVEKLTIFEQTLSPMWQKGSHVIFLVFLIGMTYIIFQLASLFFSETQAYIKTHQIPLFSELEQHLILGGKDEALDSPPSQALVVTDLTQILHVHHAVNEVYEETKQVIRGYASTRLSKLERNQQLSQLETELLQLQAYHETRLNEKTSPQTVAVYQASADRVNHALEVVRALQQSLYRSISLETLNEGISQDQPLFIQQINSFKTVLEECHIPYTEVNGKLHFSFEGFEN